MSIVSETIDVDVPVATAYNQWTQFETFPEFMGGVVSVRQETDILTHWETRIGGVKRVFDAEIVAQEPDTRIAWQSLDGVSHSGVVTFQPLSERRSRVQVELRWAAEGPLEKIGAAIGADERRVRTDLQQFKEYIENKGHPDGAWRGTVVDGEPRE
jgi:uncharacterized membrane protein